MDNDSTLVRSVCCHAIADRELLYRIADSLHTAHQAVAWCEGIPNPA
jgi:hypothetical protein